MSAAQELVDITPDKSGAREIKFVLDNNGWKYDGQFIDNLRVNKTGSALVDDLILLKETITKLYQTGQRDESNQLIVLDKVLNLIKFFEGDRLKRELFIYSGATTASPCYCGQGVYNDCHGKDLEATYHTVLVEVKRIIDEHAAANK